MISSFIAIFYDLVIDLTLLAWNEFR